MSLIYKIKPGDTLSNIAKEYDTTTEKLVVLNGIKSPDFIQVGQVLMTAPPEIEKEVKTALKKAVKEGIGVVKNKATKSLGEIKESCGKGGEVEGKFVRELGGDENIHVVYVLADGKVESGEEGASLEGFAKVGMVTMDHSGLIKDSRVGGAHKLEAMSAEVKGQMGITLDGLGVKGEASVQMIKEEASVFLGSDENNPWGEVGGEYALLQAEAGIDILQGSDGKRAGFGIGGKAGAAAAKGEIKGDINIPIPFTDWTISLRGKGGGSVGSIGGGGKVYGYKDLKSDRFHLGAGGEIAAILGVSADIDLSIGPKFDSREH